MDDKKVVIEQIFNVPASKIWSAITKKEEMKKWYFDLVEFNPIPGFQFQFTGGPTAARQYLHNCEITEVICGKKLSYTWRYNGYPGVSEVIFELTDQGEKTSLRLVHQGLETFPEDNPDLARGNFQSGWESIINSSLKAYLEISNP